MTTLTIPTVELPEIFEAYFYTSPRSSGLADFLFNKGNKDYHRMFGFRGSVVHVSVRLGNTVYEVTEEGTISYPWSEQLLDEERMVGFYTLSLKHVDRDKRLAALFTLENCLGRKLDIVGSLRYLWQTVGFGKSEDKLDMMAAVSSEDGVGLLPGHYKKTGRKEKFHLPYTCATLVNIVMNRLYDYTPCFSGHLAQSAALSLTIFAELGHGSIYDLATEEWIVGDYG